MLLFTLFGLFWIRCSFLPFWITCSFLTLFGLLWIRFSFLTFALDHVFILEFFGQRTLHFPFSLRFGLGALFRCASISWTHVGRSVNQSLFNVFDILSNLGHIFWLSSGYAQGRFKYVQSVFR